MSSHNDFLNRSRQQLDDSIEHLDGETLSRLNQARQAALASQQKHSPFSRNWLPASVTAALSLAIIGSWLLYSTPQPDNLVQTAQLDDLELLSSSTDLELLEELEFINWLVEEENAG